MRYLRVDWTHSHPDQPTTIYSEIDDDGWETRKVESFANGKRGYADALQEVGGSFLSTEPIPSFEEIARQPEFEPAFITEAEFEKQWRAAKLNSR